jgi:hypothetical protein
MVRQKAIDFVADKLPGKSPNRTFVRDSLYNAESEESRIAENTADEDRYEQQ